MSNLTIRISDEVKAQFIEQAKANGTTATALIQQWINNYISATISDCTNSTNNEQPSSTNSTNSDLGDRVAKLEATLGVIDQEGLTALLTAGNDIEHGNAIAQENRKAISDINHHLDELLNEQQTQNEQISTNNTAIAELYQKQASTSTTVSGMRDQINWLEATINSNTGLSPTTASVTSETDNGKNNDSHSDSDSELPAPCKQTALARRLKVSDGTIKTHRARPDFMEWSASYDPDGLGWTYNNKYFYPQVMDTATDSE